jgi:hypothetical protein
MIKIVLIVNNISFYSQKWSRMGGSLWPAYHRNTHSLSISGIVTLMIMMMLIIIIIVHGHCLQFCTPLPPSTTALLLVEAQQLTNRGYAHASS